MDIRDAHKTIAAAIPGARFAWTDYNASLSVAHPTKDVAFIVFQAERPDMGRDEIVGDVPAIIAKLQA